MTPTIIYHNSKFALAEMPEEPKYTDPQNPNFDVVNILMHNDRLRADYQQARSRALSEAVDFEEQEEIKRYCFEIDKPTDYVFIECREWQPKDGDHWPMPEIEWEKVWRWGPVSHTPVIRLKPVQPENYTISHEGVQMPTEPQQTEKPSWTIEQQYANHWIALRLGEWKIEMERKSVIPLVREAYVAGWNRKKTQRLADRLQNSEPKEEQGETQELSAQQLRDKLES